MPMKKIFSIIILLSAMTLQAAVNPLMKPFEDTPHQTVPFGAIDDTMWMPAIDRGIELANAEIDAITRQRSRPDFENTIVALENVGHDLNRVLNVFYPLLSANSNDTMMEVAMEASGKLSDFSTSMVLNRELWQRVKQVYDDRELFNLDAEDMRLLQKTYDSFALNGATLEGDDRDEFKRLSAELSALTTTFGQNVLKELNTYEIYLTADDLAGLTEANIEQAAEAAKARGHEGEYLFTLDQPVYSAFMQNSSRRDLRERMYRLYNGRNTQGEYSNLDNICRIADIRHRLAVLLGNPTFAAQNLRQTMAEKPEAVYDLLDRLRDAYRPALDAEMAELKAFASQLEGHDMEIHPWDYSYYSKKLREEKYSFNEDDMRPYFKLENVVDGVFGLATRLYGIHFSHNPDIEVYHPDVKAYDVTDADGSYLGVLYTDFFPRASKRPGAWMTGFKDQWIEADGTNSRPHVSIVMNFTKPTSTRPSLLSPSEVETFLHEFGHSLHGLLANTKYASLSGTAVYRDFVELPSQFNENFLTEREWLDSFARHYETGELIPSALIDRLVAARQYGAAYSCMRQLGFGYIDMAWHTVTEPVTDAAAFERKAMDGVRVFDDNVGMVSPQFSHIFSGGYAAGYYSYKWAEVLDADAFAFFKENGTFDAETAAKFRENILSKGGTVHPAELYRRFRGKDPSIDALLIRDGIKPANGTVAPINKD